MVRAFVFAWATLAATDITWCQQAADPAAKAPSFTVFQRRPEVLSEAEYQEIQRQVLTRCRLSEGTLPHEAPWYFHYEMGLELERRGDPQRALDSLLEAVARRHTPQRQARLYGMWFKDYLPYFTIARLHATLGNWQCVADALAFSREKGEIAPGDDEIIEFQELIQEVSAHKSQIERRSRWHTFDQRSRRAQ